jgi:hypothetical protein
VAHILNTFEKFRNGLFVVVRRMPETNVRLGVVVPSLKKFIQQKYLT